MTIRRDGMAPGGEGQTWAGAPPGIDEVIDELLRHQAELELENQERKLAQRLLEQSLARYVDLYDSAPVGCLTLDAEGSIGEANLTAASLLGLPRALLVGRTLPQVLPGARREALERVVGMALAGEGARAPLRFEHPSRGELLLEIVATPAVDASGSVLGCHAALIEAVERPGHATDAR